MIRRPPRSTLFPHTTLFRSPHVRIGVASVGPEVHPGRPFGPHERAERGAEVLVAERCLVEVDLAVAIQADHETGLGLERPGRGARQPHVHAALHDGGGDHEDDEQHEGHVDERCDIDVGRERQLAMAAKPAPAAQQAGHHSLPSRAIVPMISWAKPSSSPANRPSPVTNRLYAITEGTATARPPTVVTSASATPGATAAIFPEPPTAMPMKASITPSTVPSRPSSGLTEPNVASQGMKRAAASRSAAPSLASNIRSASSCVVVRVACGAAIGPSPLRPPGFSSPKKCMPSRSSRL